jgi:hypothetical protein
MFLEAAILDRPGLTFYAKPAERAANGGRLRVTPFAFSLPAGRSVFLEVVEDAGCAAKMLALS